MNPEELSPLAQKIFEGARLTSQYFGINEARRIHMAAPETQPKPERYAHAGPFMTRAMEVVYAFVKERLDKTDTVEFDITMVYVVWFSKTLGNWKALVSTALPDGKYYEVTYDGAKDCIYLDAYIKFHNVQIDFDVTANEKYDVPKELKESRA